MQEWEWPGSAGGARRGWECRSGSGLVVLEVLEVQEWEWPGSAEVLEGQSLLEIYVHQHLCTS